MAGSHFVNIERVTPIFPSHKYNIHQMFQNLADSPLGEAYLAEAEMKSTAHVTFYHRLQQETTFARICSVQKTFFCNVLFKSKCSNVKYIDLDNSSG